MNSLKSFLEERLYQDKVKIFKMEVHNNHADISNQYCKKEFLKYNKDIKSCEAALKGIKEFLK